MVEVNRVFIIVKGLFGYGEGWVIKSIIFFVEENIIVVKIFFEKCNYIEVVIFYFSGEFIVNGEWIRIEIYENIFFNFYVVILLIE